ncbi:hypothetical protein, partial [Arcobacter sp. CECT 9188]
ANFEAKGAKKEKVNTTAPRNNINIFTKYSMNDFSVGAGVNWNIVDLQIMIEYTSREILKYI